MTDVRTPVLIVGGGLVGLSAAVFLTWQGQRPLLVERRPGTSAHPRARGVNVRAMELFRQVGLEERIRATESARALADNSGIVQLDSLAGHRQREFLPGYLEDGTEDLSPTGWTLCEQDELEPLLRERAEEAGADLRFGHELIAHAQDADGVTATVRDLATDARYTVRARYLVAADGAAGPVRGELGIPRSGRGVLARYLNIHFRADLTEVLGDRRFLMAYVHNADVSAGLLPVNNKDRWLLHVPLGSDRESWNEQRCEAAVRAAAGVPQLPVKILGAQPWDAAALVANRFRHGRIFLAGDAAHAMPPTGAFGSGTGVQDAHNLAWKLATVLRGDADAHLLDTYESERLPAARATVEQAVLRSLDRPGRKATAPAGTILPDHAVALGCRYPAPGATTDDGVLVRRLTGTPGTRAPHMWLERDGNRISSLDLYDGRSIVLVAGERARHWYDAARRLSPLVTSHHIGAHGLADPLGRWAEVHGVPPTGAVLVRPDGYVLERFDGSAPGAALTGTLSTFLGRPAAPRPTAGSATTTGSAE
ncbi:FAD-dependent monooxygenase [Streptomyces sp. NPDC028722]|uniref:FAD-dependent monooxygenase n=1 Tax=Streptomyces sp. NPDC028722 TaxID=3155016 RepID=UPI0033DB1B46